MNILFICGSMEPGKDGVGDYTRRLAGELTRQGHQTAVIALNDRHLRVPICIMKQQDTGTELTVLRLSPAVSWQRRMTEAQDFVTLQDPEWLSLQFVPFSFQEKGLPIGLGRRLKKLGKGRKWHVMFHELWVKAGSNKTGVLGSLQRFLIRQILDRIGPALIHTHLPLYREKLTETGFTVLPLSLFSNIAAAGNTANRKKNGFTAGFFSQVSFDPLLIHCLQSLANECNRADKEMTILLIGGNSVKMMTFQDYLKRNLPAGIDILSTGYLDASEISAHLQSCDVGITPLPVHALGKSGSVLAFLSHQVPVIALANNNDQHGFPPFFLDEYNECIVFDKKLEAIHQTKIMCNQHSYKFGVDYVCKTYINDLLRN